MVLDEPNSNLDSEGERALARAIGAVRSRGGIVVVIAHRPSLIGATDHLLVLNEGRMQAFGTTKSVLPLLTPKRAAMVKPGSEPLETARSAMTQQAARMNSTGQSIRRHAIAVGIAAAFLVCSIGIMGAATDMSGAIISQGSLVVESSIKKVQHARRRPSPRRLHWSKRAFASTKNDTLLKFALDRNRWSRRRRTCPR